MDLIANNVSITLTPKEIAHIFWQMHDDEQAEFFESLQKQAGSHLLVTQGLSIREACKKRSPQALEGFQNLSVCAFKWLGDW